VKALALPRLIAFVVVELPNILDPGVIRIGTSLSRASAHPDHRSAFAVVE
jgi:hypothetical protein